MELGIGKARWWGLERGEGSEGVGEGETGGMVDTLLDGLVSPTCSSNSCSGGSLGTGTEPGPMSGTS
jgi:hypothetical protein